MNTYWTYLKIKHVASITLALSLTAIVPGCAVYTDGLYYDDYEDYEYEQTFWSNDDRFSEVAFARFELNVKTDWCDTAEIQLALVTPAGHRVSHRNRYSDGCQYMMETSACGQQTLAIECFDNVFGIYEVQIINKTNSWLNPTLKYTIYTYSDLDNTHTQGTTQQPISPHETLKLPIILS